MHHGSRREFLIEFLLFFVLGILKIEFVDLMASFRSGVLAPGCICFLYLMHFKISKIANKKIGTSIFTCYVAYKVISTKISLLGGLSREDKIRR
jgi:hypothetical protein